MKFSTARFGKILAAGAAVAFAAAALPASAAPAATTVNWAQDGFIEANSGYNAFETSITTSTVADLNWQWAITSPVARPRLDTSNTKRA